MNVKPLCVCVATATKKAKHKICLTNFLIFLILIYI